MGERNTGIVSCPYCGAEPGEFHAPPKEDP